MPGLRREAASISQTQSQSGGGSVSTIPHFVRLDFAYACRTVFYVMAGIMAAAALVALVGLQRGVQPESDEDGVTRAGADEQTIRPPY